MADAELKSSCWLGLGRMHRAAYPLLVADQLAQSDLAARILGGLYGAASGDAMGAATETLSRRQVVDTFGRVDSMLEPVLNPYAHGRHAGQVTDDTGQLVWLARRAAREDRLSPELVAEALLEWAAADPAWAKMAGPTTRGAIADLKGGRLSGRTGQAHTAGLRGVTAGAAVKAAVAGWLHPGDVSAAVADAIIVCAPTHATVVAMSGASAVAAAVAAAAGPLATIDAVLRAAIEGAEEGERLARASARDVPSPSVTRRLRLALAIASAEWDEAAFLDELAGVVGAGVHVAEVVPSAFGVLAHWSGCAETAIVAAVNVGNDSDTIACIVGAVAGTLGGIGCIPPDWVQTLGEQNDLELEGLAVDLAGYEAVPR